MGRVKTIAVKTLADDLIKLHGNKFTAKFEKNKQILAEVRPIKSKKVRNVLAGYIAKKTKSAEQPKVVNKPEE